MTSDFFRGLSDLFATYGGGNNAFINRMPFPRIFEKEFLGEASIENQKGAKHKVKEKEKQEKKEEKQS